MNSNQFGTTSKALRSTTAGQEESVAEFDDMGNADPDKPLQCPYDKNHIVRACRFPYHLLKCRKNHPKLARALKTCPYNARHLIPEHEFSHHRETCEDGLLLKESDATNNVDCKWQVPGNSGVQLNMTEDWEEGGTINRPMVTKMENMTVMHALCSSEADDEATPFVWGTSTAVSPRLEINPTNIFGNGLRIPHTLPWSNH